MSVISIIGSGFSGLSAACYLAQKGVEVHVFEKNEIPGGRARQFTTENGFVFDMGPSWYWMPDVFEDFFNDFNKKVSDYYTLDLLQPAFDIIFEKGELESIPNNFDELCVLFEKIEKGGAEKLKQFMVEAQYKYDTAMSGLIYKPGISVTEFAKLDVIKGVFRLEIFSSFSKHIRKFFKNEKLIALMEFPILFLGAMPKDTPALYSLMNYAGLKLGTWYPQGGFGKVIESFVELAKSLGVQFHFNSTVEKINSENGKSNSILVNGNLFTHDGVVASADYNHVETKLLNNKEANYSNEYWEKKTFAPSSLLFYLGLNKKIDNINHHTLFFDTPIEQHAIEIYQTPKYPSNPLFYMCCPSKTDANVAPEGCENVFLLMPIAAGLEDNEETRENYFKIMLKRIENQFEVEIENHIIYKKSYCVNDFIADYNSFKGNAYGLANTLMQTAILKPKMINKKIKNLIYAGQLTVPGPGVPPSIISGKIASELMLSYLEKNIK